MTKLTIDAHQHFWKMDQFDNSWMDAPELAPLKRDYLPHDLKPLIDRAEVNRTIIVQTQHFTEENVWALELADQFDFIAGVVGWVDLTSPACEEQLLAVADHPKFVGIRHITEGETDVDFIVRDDVLRGLKVLERHRVPFDLLFLVKHLHHAKRLARELPELPLVIDHLAKPHIKEGRIEDWLPNLNAAAKFPNVFCKLSGMVTEAAWHAWTTDNLKPYVHAVLDAFGPERCLFGSDWPVCTLAAGYHEVVDALRETVSELSPTEQSQIFGQTAAQFYGVDLRA